jgi:hypothetical protein
MFNDNNDVNEKSVVGFIAFLVMIGFAVVDIVTGIAGKELVISDTIFNSFLIITLGAFGISEVSKVFKNKKNGSDFEEG